MRAIRVASAALLATVALSLTAPTAALADESAGTAGEGASSAGTGSASTGTEDTAGAGTGSAGTGTSVGATPSGGAQEGGTPVDSAAGVGTPAEAAPVEEPPVEEPPVDGAQEEPTASVVAPPDGTGQNITSFGFSVSPSTVAPGGTVTLKSDACEAPSVTVTSGIFETVTLTEGRAGTATVDVEARIGAEYQVTFDCKGEKGTAALVVAGGSTGTSTGGHDTGAQKGVKAGFGGGAGQLGAVEAATGTALIAGALGGGGVLLLRRRRADGRG
ncbi:hypothetical protein M5362_08630 [Streptomyces sp. Je 1-79]|uniref:hypothetical protein n=1 Tax=Streptomyces sp. Je 1-79 TaxID=2943847 RepID=UPI0021A6A22D|nr:hypothetical protein [Streptomyces sp. Je 1-79]MCT4353194.1 hypothetical protein [Streptomyces sp. Je 1-79]